MLGFMMGVLGSVLFWCFYISISFFIAATLCKYKDNESCSHIINVLIRKTITRYETNYYDYEDTPNFFDRSFYSFLFICLMILWPFWIIVVIIKLIIRNMFRFIECIIVFGLKHVFTIKLEISNK